MPAFMFDMYSMLVLEFEPDEELGRAMKDWIGCDEKHLIGIDADQQGCEKAELVLP
jgi:hypothetical protein